jgi:hypothetical protein
LIDPKDAAYRKVPHTGSERMEGALRSFFFDFSCFSLAFFTQSCYHYGNKQKRRAAMKLSRQFIRASAEICDFDHHVPAPYLRRAFTLDFVPQIAEITICDLGFY